MTPPPSARLRHRLLGLALGALTAAAAIAGCAAPGSVTAHPSVAGTPESSQITAAPTPSAPGTRAAPQTHLEESALAAPSTGYEEPDGDAQAAPDAAGHSGAGTAAGDDAAPGEHAASGTAKAQSGEDAASALRRLPVKGRAPMTGYSRDEFGRGWKDPDRNGCDGRNDILGRDLTAKQYKPHTHDCVVLSGILHDPYTGQTIAFTRGVGTSQLVQIDHVVALADAWQKGAQKLSASERLALANDPLNLLAVQGRANSAKGAGDAATWLPPRKAFRCQYVARQVAVKARYRLWVTTAERDAIARILARCPGEALPRG